AAPLFCVRCAMFVVPGIGTMHGFWASSHASAICDGTASLRSAQRCTTSTSRGDVMYEIDVRLEGTIPSLDGEAVGFTPDAVELQPDGRIVILDSRQVMRYTADG